MNDDTISRQAAIDAVQQHREDVLGGYEYDEGVAFVYAAAHNHIIAVIKQLPSAERRGRWINGNEGIWNAVILPKCSICGETFYEMNVNINGEYPYNYCPNCGAKMDEENDG